MELIKSIVKAQELYLERFKEYNKKNYSTKQIVEFIKVLEALKQIAQKQSNYNQIQELNNRIRESITGYASVRTTKTACEIAIKNNDTNALFEILQGIEIDINNLIITNEQDTDDDLQF